MDKLTHVEFSNYKKLMMKKYRRIERCFIIEGLHLIEEAIKKSIVKVIITSDREFICNDFKKIKYTSYQNICTLSSTKTPQPYIAICKFLDEQKFDANKNILILNKINDPGNLGTLIRTAKAFEFENIIVEGVDIYNPKVLRSSQGAIFDINIFNTNNLEKSLIELKQKHNFQIIGSFLDEKAQNYHSIKYDSKSIALVLGNEAKGIDKTIEKIVDLKTYIPINFESLNVAVAGGILMARLSNIKK